MTEDLRKLTTWKYEFDDAVISTKDGNFDIPKENIITLFIEKDFDNSFIPITRLTVLLTPSIIYAIKNSYNSATIRIGVKKFRSSDNFEDISVNRFLSKYFENTFEIYETDRTPFLHENATSGGDEYQRPEDEDGPINLYLICRNHSTYYRTLTNNIVRGVTMTDVIAYTLGNVRVPTPVLMTPLDNNTRYPEFWILPYNLLGMLKFLHKEEGLYNTGYRVFQDYDMLYILDRSIGSRKVFLDPKEITRVKIDMLKTAEDVNIYYGCFTFEDKYHFINCLEVPTVVVPNIDTKNLAFTAFHSVSEIRSGSSLINANADTYDSKKSYRILQNQLNNQFANNSLQHMIEEQNKKVQCVLEEIDLTMIKPYFQYELVFDKHLGGSISGIFRLSYQQIILTRIGDCVDGKTVCHFISK